MIRLAVKVAMSVCIFIFVSHDATYLDPLSARAPSRVDLQGHSCKRTFRAPVALLEHCALGIPSREFCRVIAIQLPLINIQEILGGRSAGLTRSQVDCTKPQASSYGSPQVFPSRFEAICASLCI